MSAGLHPSVIIAAAQRQVMALHKTRLAIDDGSSDVSRALESGFARLHFSRKTAVETALRNWTGPRLSNVIGQLGEAAFAMRQQASMAQTIAHRALVAIAVNARRRG